MPSNDLYKDAWWEARKLRRSLVGDGWKTPNTYDNCYAEPISDAAVYLFLLHGWDSRDDFHDFESSLVAYVGMSKSLSRRWKSHPILREIEATGRYVQKWFLPVREDDLRDQERDLIKKYDPPWNIQGRSRGVQL